jgi:hypothetical protein
MTEQKHTPGPWKFREYLSGTICVVMREWVGPQSSQYGTGYLAANIDAFNIDFQNENDIRAERIANARLIAAAPELFAALEGIMHWAHWANEKMGYDIDPKFPEWDKAKSALAKAKVSS